VAQQKSQNDKKLFPRLRRQATERRRKDRIFCNHKLQELQFNQRFIDYAKVHTPTSKSSSIHSRLEEQSWHQSPRY